MTDLIDISYFIGEINIAQLGQRSVQVRVGLFITKYEADYLLKILGYEFSKLFNTAREANDLAGRWGKLINGDEYTDADGNVQYWTGFSNEALMSPIANYTYFFFARDNASVTTASSEVVNNKKESINIGPAMKQMKAWNGMVDMNYKLYDFLINKKTDGVRVYTEFDYTKMGCKAQELFQRINPEPFLL